jgi:sensor histidine kinase YesM
MNNRIVYVVIDNGVGRKAAEQISTGKDKSYGLEMSYERVKLFNKETLPSVEIEDLYEGGRSAGTRIEVRLNII